MTFEMPVGKLEEQGDELEQYQREHNMIPSSYNRQQPQQHSNSRNQDSKPKQQ